MTVATDNKNAAATAAAKKIKPLLPKARTAFGSQLPGSPARVASDKVNELVLGYADAGHPMPALARALEPEISLSGLRRRLRLARAAGKGGTELGHSDRPRGTTDPATVKKHADKIAKARLKGGGDYGDAVRAAYADGVALKPIAEALGVSYFSVWNAMRTAY